MSGVSITVGRGLSVHGTSEAIHRVQLYLLLDSNHPIEREDVRRSLARSLQAAEAKLAKLDAFHSAWVRYEVSLATGSDELVQQARGLLISRHHAVREMLTGEGAL